MSLLEPRVHARIDRKRSELERLRPLNTAQVAKLRGELQLEMTYHSNAIEGNTLTLRETQLVLEEDITIKGRSLREHLEARAGEALGVESRRSGCATLVPVSEVTASVTEERSSGKSRGRSGAPKVPSAVRGTVTSAPSLLA